MNRKTLRKLLVAFLFLTGGLFGLPCQEAPAAVQTVVLDPGHGGGETGAWGTYGGVTYKEEEINWKISNYTMQALAEYSGVKVYLTRSQNQYMGVSARAERAAALGADLLVSQHINSATSSTAHGASVMISKGTYRPYLAQKERAFGAQVMQELGALGIYRRFPETGGMEYRMSENGSKYPNGGLRDYYGIVARSVELNLPGVIIEHAFVSNYNDVMSFLSTDAKLKKLGQADARAIAKYLNLQFKKDGWVQENGHWYYYVNGKVKTGWITEGNSRYYCNEKGVMQTGWLLYSGAWYYLHPESGKMAADEILQLGGDIYYQQADGTRKTGFTWVRGYCYYFTPGSGKAHKGWLKSINGNWRYMGTKTGRMTRNQLFTQQNKHYYVAKNGIAAQNAWATINGKKYYFRSDCSAATGWFSVKGKRYLANANGQILTNQLYRSPSTGKICYLTEEGVRHTGWKQVDGKWYYMDPKTGIAVSGWVRSSGKWYYLDSKTYVMKTASWIHLQKKYYYVDNTGAMLTGLKKINGEWYYLQSNGVRKTGWMKSGGKWYYFRPSTGVMLRNMSGKIGGKVYRFASNGVCLNP